ncbi:MAG: holo-[acyl-carrier protein] synthase [Desulfovibrionales bacterium]|nr:holo-[acyl-carrier protein] synthase [Desulfovibrionales bacterium]
MIVGLGSDVTELDRIEALLRRYGDRFVRKILTPREMEIMPSRNPVPFLAARFAGKEAASKALGVGFSNGVTLLTLEIDRMESGQPCLEFLGPALERAKALKVRAAHISLTHGRDVAQAVVVLEG